MDSINYIKIAGRVGSMKKSANVARLSVATSRIYKSRSGDTIEETTWFTVTVFGEDKVSKMPDDMKGMFVEVEGRVRVNRYNDSSYWDVIPTSFKWVASK